MPFITYPQPNGQLAVIIPCGAVEDCIKDVPEGVPYKIVDSLEVENDYFNAYEFSEELGAEVNISKAKDLHKDKFRTARKPLLEVLDVAFMRAVEAGDTVKQAEIASKKQELRDITKINLPNTLEELKAVWPEVLS